MAIKWTGYDRIELDDGTAISVNSETPGSPSAHSKVVGAIIEAVGKIDDSDEAVGKIEGSHKPTYNAPTDAGQVPCSEVDEADPKPEEPAGNPPALMSESKPRLLIDIAKSTDLSKKAKKAILLTFSHLYEAFDRDEERAMAFVKCIASTKLNDVLVISMSNGQVIMAEAYISCPVGHDKLVELAEQTIACVAAATAIDYVVNVR